MIFCLRLVQKKKEKRKERQNERNMKKKKWNHQIYKHRKCRFVSRRDLFKRKKMEKNKQFLSILFIIIIICFGFVGINSSWIIFNFANLFFFCVFIVWILSFCRMEICTRQSIFSEETSTSINSIRFFCFLLDFSNT